MAAGTSLRLKFGTAYGEKTFVYKYGNAEATRSAVKNLMNTMIANGSVFRFPPLTKVSAIAQMVTEAEFDLSDD